MFRKPLLLLLAGLLTCWIPLCAQDETPPEDPAAEKPKAGDSPNPGRFWQAKLSDGHFMVALDRIVSVSRHKYLLDGALIVDEVTVDTVGQALARFYFISPISDAAPGNTVSGLANRGRELIDKAADRAGTSAQNMVVKKYPDTTHAKAIEYRVLSEAELTSLYSSVRTAWENGKGRQFTAK
ncbi:MAG TPA: hypothetical protein VF258_04695 [Luteolibacter sp.]